MESFLWVAVVIGNGTTVVFPEGLLTMSTLSNVYEEVKIFHITELRKSRGDTDDPFGLKRKDHFLKYIH